MKSLRHDAEPTGTSAPALTLVAPWIAQTDWSSVMVDYFVRLLGGSQFVNVLSGHAPSSVSMTDDPFAYLDPKLDIAIAIRQAQKAGCLANRVLLIDTNFVNVRALRTLLGTHGRIIALVNGGAFQPFDFDCQSMPAWSDRIAAYESGLFGLCDAVLVPSQHARHILFAGCPHLSARVETIPYPLRPRAMTRPDKRGKAGAIFVSRPTYEKGADLVDRLIAKGHPVTRTQGLEGEVYFAALQRHLCVLTPARAELFGYVAIEALQAGLIPIAPDGLSYREFLHLPDWLFLSHPVDDATPAQMAAVIERIEDMSDAEYAAIVTGAQMYLGTVFADQNARFRAALAI